MKNNFIQLNDYERIELFRIAAAVPSSMSSLAVYLDILTSPKGFYDESCEVWQGLRHIRNILYMRTNQSGFKMLCYNSWFREHKWCTENNDKFGLRRLYLMD